MQKNAKLTKGGALDHYVASDRPDWLFYFLLTFFVGREAKSTATVLFHKVIYRTFI